MFIFLPHGVYFHLLNARECPWPKKLELVITRRRVRKMGMVWRIFLIVPLMQQCSINARKGKRTLALWRNSRLAKLSSANQFAISWLLSISCFLHPGLLSILDPDSTLRLGNCLRNLPGTRLGKFWASTLTFTPCISLHPPPRLHWYAGHGGASRSVYLDCNNCYYRLRALVWRARRKTIARLVVMWRRSSYAPISSETFE